MKPDATEDARKARSAGCIGATIVIPVFIFLWFASAMSDCLPLAPCERSVLREAVLPSLIVALIVSQGCYWTARWVQRRRL
jgi:hypothetical protein